MAMGIAQLLLWIGVAVAAEQFNPDDDFGQRPLLLVVGLLAASFLLYLASLALVWKAPEHQPTARRQWQAVVIFAVLFRLALWWSQPIQELDLYRYLWDGRVLAEGINPYRYSPEQIDLVRSSPAARDKSAPTAAEGGESQSRLTSAATSAGGDATPELATLDGVLRRSPEVAKIFSLIDHRSVPTIYPPLSEAVFAATALITPARAPMRVQVSVFKGVLLVFDLATVVLVMGLLRNLNQPPARALAYAWCPLVLKEFANTGHLDAIAVCLTAAVFWLLTLPRGDNISASVANPFPMRPQWRDWLATGLWGGAVLAKLYPVVLAPVLLAFWWRRVRWRTGGLFAAFALTVLGGYALLPPNAKAPQAEAVATREHSSFSGLGEFLRRWEMNDLLFSVGYENVRLRFPEHAGQEPWYSVLPRTAREQLNTVLAQTVALAGLDVPVNRLSFLFTQALAAGTLLFLAGLLAWRRWPGDPRETLLRRSFLCLAWLWFLSATQNPWYWTWAMPLAVFVSRAWLLVSGFALIYYLRFWFVHQFPNATLPGDLTGLRFFDEVVVWIEHLPPLCAVVLAAILCRKRVWANRAADQPLPPPANSENVVVVIPALNEEASLPQVIVRLQALGLFRIRVVDNGSQDRTAVVARHSSAEVICEPRRGYGQACWTGCENLPPDAEWILFCNADGSDDIERIPELLTATASGAEFILGARISGKDGNDYLTLPQRFGNKLAVNLIRLLWGARHADLGPLRLISRRAFRDLNLQDRGFGWTVEMQVRAAEEGLNVTEVPVRNFPRSGGVSKISGTIKGSIQAGMIILTTIVSLWLRPPRGATPGSRTS
jgi:hypothetical protein